MAVVGDVDQEPVTDGDGGAAPMEVLVVDDEPEIAELSRIYLERVDDAMTVTLATDPSSGLEYVDERGFDAVVADYHMPTMDGLTFIDRATDVAPATAGVVFSSDDAPGVVRRVREAGVPYVQKRMRDERFERLADDLRAAVRNRRD